MIDGELSYQSALTSSLVEEILTYGRCGLPSLVDSASSRRYFFSMSSKALEQ